MTANKIEVGAEIETPEGEPGVITFAEHPCPDIFYISVRYDNISPPRSYYLVAGGAVPQIISAEAARYGSLVGDTLFFEEGAPGSGWELVDFEVSRYKLGHGASLDNDDIYTLSRVYCERYPEYFGGLEVPKNTPFGRVIRLKKVAEGSYFTETEKLRWLLAVHHVIWQDDDLSGYAKSLGALDEQGGDTPYMFFTLKNSTPAIYELLALKQYRGLLKYIQSEQALVAALYQHHFSYVVNSNLLELSGQGMTDMISHLRRLADFMYGVDIDDTEDESLAEQREKNCIALPAGVSGKGLFLLPR